MTGNNGGVTMAHLLEASQATTLAVGSLDARMGSVETGLDDVKKQVSKAVETSDIDRRLIKADLSVLSERRAVDRDVKNKKRLFKRNLYRYGVPMSIASAGALGVSHQALADLIGALLGSL